MSFVEISGLTKVFPNGFKAIDNLDLSIKEGEFFALLGPSGCGKTTLLRTLGGLESASSGVLKLGDREVTRMEPGKRNVAMVFQDYALYPHMTVEENIGYPLKIRKEDKEVRAQRIADASAALSIEPLLDRRPSQISGGQQQRVAVARAVATRPDLYLFDEPLSNLDARLRLEARTFLKQLQRDLNVTTIFVTHDQSEALALSDRMAVMEAGKIRQVGTPTELFRRPANTFVAGFIGSTPMNLLPGVIRSGKVDLGGVSVALPQTSSPVTEGMAVVYGLRPEYAAIVPENSSELTGVVKVLENLGSQYMVSLDINGVQIRGMVADGNEPLPGTRVSLQPEAARVLLYSQESGDLL